MRVLLFNLFFLHFDPITLYILKKLPIKEQFWSLILFEELPNEKNIVVKVYLYKLWLISVPLSTQFS